MKYFLLGSFATAFFLYGIALVYGSSGTTMLTKMGSEELLHSTLFELGLAMILIGLGFKVAAAPFQVWTPDVYEGAPTPLRRFFPRDEGCGVRFIAAHLCDGSCRHALLVLGFLGARGAYDVRRQSWARWCRRTSALLAYRLHCARRLYFGGVCGRYLHGARWIGGSSAGLCGGALLSAQLRAREARGIHDRFATGRHGEKHLSMDDYADYRSGSPSWRRR